MWGVFQRERAETKSICFWLGIIKPSGIKRPFPNTAKITTIANPEIKKYQ